MITSYHRPQTLEQALTLIARHTPKTLPLGGGTFLSHFKTDLIEVVDLQSLGLDQIRESGRNLDLGATATLQQLLNSQICPNAVKVALQLEAPLNIRNTATLAGTLVVADGRSPFTAVMLALDAKLLIQPGDQELQIGSFLPLRALQLKEKLITGMIVPLHVALSFDFVSRTPVDKPILSVALAKWPSGRTRLVVGGFGKAPILAMDGTESNGIEAALHNALEDSADDWASAEYRQAVAAILARRCLEKMDQ